MRTNKGELSPAQLQGELDTLLRRISIIHAQRRGTWTDRIGIEPLRVDEATIRHLVLVLGAGSAIIPDEMDTALSSINRYGLCPDSVAIVIGADAAERIKVFGMIRAMAEEGLVSLDAWAPKNEPRSFVIASIAITVAGMRHLGLADEHIPCLPDHGDEDGR